MCRGLRAGGLQKALLETPTLIRVFPTRYRAWPWAGRQSRSTLCFRENERSIPAQLADILPGDRDRRRRGRVSAHRSTRPPQCLGQCGAQLPCARRPSIPFRPRQSARPSRSATDRSLAPFRLSLLCFLSLLRNSLGKKIKGALRRVVSDVGLCSGPAPFRAKLIITSPRADLDAGYFQRAHTFSCLLPLSSQAG